MDYEKAYKESFEAAKGLHDAGNALTKKQMEIVFPQLAESEDERNWKKVEGAIRGFLTNPIDADELLAWLEKQKEQKPAEWSEDIIRKAVKEVGLTQHQIDWFKTNVFPLKVEWSEEDEGELQNAIDALEFLGKKGVYKSESGYDAALQAASWLENLLERFNLQPEQEWGEDNDKDIAHIIRVLNDCYEYGKHDLSKTDYENLVGTVKFLRNRPKPSDTWKPSEEQMKWLKDVIETVPMTCRQQGPLESLYNDLLKLSNDCINTYHRTFIQEL